jgi:glycosyltransferase involved in cell wall biosynthesis
VHNLFPNFGTRWLTTWTGPVVATLHNFRPVCANGLLFRDGHYCEECPTSSKLAAVRYGCYHGSRAASIPLALRNARGPARNVVLDRADALISLSEQAADHYRRLTQLDLPIHVIPNGVDVPSPERAPESNGRWVVVSRLTPEKGVHELVEIWPKDEVLDVIGAGPQASSIAALGRPSVRMLGARTRADIQHELPSYLGLVFPSRCLEMQPTVLVETLAAGTPVVALTGSAGAALIDAGAGLTYTDGGSLANALTMIRAGRTDFGVCARDLYLRRFRRSTWVDSLIQLYASAIAAR